MLLLSPEHFPEYELIDSGEYEKLERFGNYILRRPEPQAVWRKTMDENEWQKRTDAFFKKEKGKAHSGDANEKGEWILKKGMPEQWNIHYSYKKMKLTFRLGLTAFKHVGIFPEQAANWDFIYETIQEKENKPEILNLFAYTGGASLAARSAGAEVTHLDAVRQVLTWSRENMEKSGLDNIKWVLEDALKFTRREAKRNKKYHGIILDPPAYGRGPAKEKWVLEENIRELLQYCSDLLHEKDSFVILNLYSMGFSSLIAENICRDYFGNTGQLEAGELYIPDKYGKKLPLSVYCRFRR